MSKDSCERFLQDLHALINEAVETINTLKTTEGYFDMASLHEDLQDNIKCFTIAWGPEIDEETEC